jgi:oligopeptide/dipeptide ABC transporter ATP-binding protein
LRLRILSVSSSGPGNFTRIVELADARTIIDQLRHPSTQAQISAVPVPDPARERSRRWAVLVSELSGLVNPPSGCSFHTRCPLREDRCSHEVPPLRTVATWHQVACHVVE